MRLPLGVSPQPEALTNGVTNSRQVSASVNVYGLGLLLTFIEFPDRLSSLFAIPMH